MIRTNETERALRWVAAAQRLGMNPRVIADGLGWILEVSEPEMGVALWSLLTVREWWQPVTVCDVQEELDLMGTAAEYWALRGEAALAGLR